ncbi:related to glutaredoxin [Rhynchosporium agropyri]|uniref:Related to glutaredoxin n=1 Tax=Rhynchosporium agropyri TaxID=914238 RepID=A0A1E1KQ47_9HELO|nr:related to glutaredoxin [Rhynchosporium agropyri]
MPSVRRIKVFGLLIVMAIITLLFYTNSGGSDLEARQTGDFFHKTKSALEKSPVGGGSSTAGMGKVVGTSDEDKEASKARLKEAAQMAKDNANMKAPKPDPPSKVVGVGSAAEGGKKGVAGRKKFGSGGSEAQEPIKDEKKKGDEDLDVEAEFNSILKKSPIIIYSKSYCPHSKRAKDILLEKYLIDPKPYVVELDQHKLGLQIQAKLADLTGRRTVPNVLVNGKSIGGGDEVAELDTTGKLVDKILNLGGKRMAEVKLRPVNGSKATVKEKEKVVENPGHGLK